MDEKINALADILVNYSLNVKEKEKVLITSTGEVANDLIYMLVKKIASKGGMPFVKYISNEIDGLIKEVMTEDMVHEIVKRKEFEVNNYDSFITITCSSNEFENKNKKMDMVNLLGKACSKLDHIRINERKWVILNYPTKLDAYKAEMPTRDYYEYAMNAMIFDYQQMKEDSKALKKLMEETNRVRILGPNTDLTFSIKDMPAVPCMGEYNIPDGEVFTAPVKDSVNGIISFNTKTIYMNNLFSNVRLEFKDGKITNATCDSGNQEKLEEILNMDEGARYVGEFSLGFNPLITEPMGDILFDEKIKGSLHLTPGKCYDEAPNGNDSIIHWDLVLIQREEYGGGEIYFDDVLIRKDGKFVLEELKPLNYDQVDK